MSAYRYVKSQEILPPDLIAEIHKHFRGGFLYVPPRRCVARIKRDLEIVGMAKAGKTITEIAETYLLSRPTVRSILSKAGGKNA